MVKCQKDRSQSINRFLARRRLTEILEERILGKQSEEQARVYQIRKQKRRRSRRAKEKMLQAKKMRSNLKEMRKSLDILKNGE
jgi:protein subunit release factor B